MYHSPSTSQKSTLSPLASKKVKEITLSRNFKSLNEEVELMRNESSGGL